MGIASLALALAFSVSAVVPANAATVALGSKNCASAPVYVAVQSSSSGTVVHTINQSPGVSYGKTYYNFAGVVTRTTKSGYVAAYSTYASYTGITWGASVFCSGPS